MQTEGLICPLDHSPLSLEERSLVCLGGHRFDLAKQGYCHLLPVQDKRSKDPGDSKAMVKARSEFLDSGLYQSIAQQVQQQLFSLLADATHYVVVDAGCGEGYYLDYLAQHWPDERCQLRAIGFDISKWAVAKAARRNDSVSWLVASNRMPPIADQYADLFLCMFGFVQYQAFASKLKPGGYLLLVDAAAEHLLELRNIIYPELKSSQPFDQRPAEQAGFTLLHEFHPEPVKIQLDQLRLQQLLLMTPHFFKASAKAKEGLAKLNQLEVTIDIQLRVFQKQK